MGTREIVEHCEFATTVDGGYLELSVTDIGYSGCLLDLARVLALELTLEDPGLGALAGLDLAPEEPGAAAEIIPARRCQTDGAMTAIVRLQKNRNVLECSG